MTSTLIVAHRRVDTAQQVVKAVVDAGVTDVWAWVDGPRTSVEAEQTAAVVSLLQSQDWPGEFHLLENHSNHGVARAVPAALDWVFAHRDEAVVLEDDCVPTPEFFEFTAHMLELYRDDPRVAMVSGTRIVKARVSADDFPYTFSSFPLIWGWGTWADRWARYTHDIRGWRWTFGVRDLWRQGGLLHAWDWYRIFKSVATDDPWSWDYQLTHMMWRWDQVAAVPNLDLVENVGFGNLASHTTERPHWAPNPPGQDSRARLIEKLAAGPKIPAVADAWVDAELRRLLFSPPILDRALSRLRPRV